MEVRASLLQSINPAGKRFFLVYSVVPVCCWAQLRNIQNLQH